MFYMKSEFVHVINRFTVFYDLLLIKYRAKHSSIGRTNTTNVISQVLHPLTAVYL